MIWQTLYCVSNSQNPEPGTDIVKAHLFSDSFYTADHPTVLRYCATMAKNTKNPRERSVPNHFFMEVGKFNPALANIHDVFWTRGYTGLFKVKVPMLRRLLTVRNDWTRK